MRPKILLVDDEEAILKHMRSALASDYTVFTASSAGDAMRIYEENRPPVITVDLALNPQNPADLAGIRVLEEVLARDPSTRAIVLTGQNNESVALRAMELGAFDYYTKPIRLDELKMIINRGVHLHRLLHKARQTREPLLGTQSWTGTTSVTKGRQSVQDHPRSTDSATTDINLKTAKRAIEIAFIKKALTRNCGVVSRAARELGISRVNLYDLIQKYDIRPDHFKVLRGTAKSQTGEVS